MSNEIYYTTVSPMYDHHTTTTLDYNFALVPGNPERRLRAVAILETVIPTQLGWYRGVKGSLTFERSELDEAIDKHDLQ